MSRLPLLRLGDATSPRPASPTGRRIRVSRPGDSHEREADRIAESVTRMPDPQLQRTCACGGSCPECGGEFEEGGGLQVARLRDGDARGSVAPDSVHEALSSPGQPLDASVRSFMEPRFGHDFSSVRVHTDLQAAESARAVSARAYTVGSDIVFAEGQYAPGTVEGRRVLAHELAHTVQQGGADGVLQRISFDDCTTGQETIVQAAHNRAVQMLDNGIRKLGIYNGTTPADVKTALDTHFHGSSSGLAGWIRFNLQYLRLFVNAPQYECQSTQSIPNPAWTAWCVPFTDIELYPNWFRYTLDVQARTMIHEWVHHYGCNFDLGYRNREGYSGHGTARSLFNADPWAWLLYDIR